MDDHQLMALVNYLDALTQLRIANALGQDAASEHLILMAMRDALAEQFNINPNNLP